jgi:hypothetical protein
MDSLIVKECPPLLDEFQKKQFTLLWKGNSDGFNADDFHRCCDNHPNTLTLILDTEGNMFGGFTPVKWEHDCGFKADESLRSFLFSLRNPHGIQPRRFPLKQKQHKDVIFCDDGWCATFGDNGDIWVKNQCNIHKDNHTHFGTIWQKSTAYKDKTEQKNFFTGAERFTVKEIEVFEITD